MMLYEAAPSFLTRVHSHTGGPFGGESALHIAIVNRHEDLLIQMIDMAVAKLDPNEVRRLLRSNAEGVFFEGNPMRTYGGSVLSYACAFGMERAVLRLLETGHVDVNDRDSACKITGFLPIHTTIASRNMAMYDFLTTSLDVKLRANIHTVTRVGKLTHLYHYSLSPLQLATQLGDHEAVRHILKKQCDVEWVWGPVTQFSLDLEGVESAGKGGGDIMELIVRTGASKRTTMMLLDSFMDGFIYKLFLRKWKLYGRTLHCAHVLLDFMLTVSVTCQTIALKSDPFEFSQSTSNYFCCVLNLVLISISVEEEIRTCFLFAANQQGEGDARISLRKMLEHGYHFALAHGVHVQLAAYAFTAIGAVVLLGVQNGGLLPAESELLVTPGIGWYSYSPDYQPGYHDASGNWTPSASGSGSGSGRILATEWPADGEGGGGGHGFASGHRLLKAKGSGPPVAEIEMFSQWEIRDEGVWSLLWLVQSFAIVTLMMHLATISFKPYQDLYILSLSIFKMLRRDLTTFMIVFLWFMVACYFTLFTVYPRSGSSALPIAEQFNTHEEAIFALIDLAFLGERFSINLLEDAFSAMGPLQTLDVWVFIVFYYFFMIVAIILMINLLIAMMSHTFDGIRQEAVLQSRLGFASLVMKLELIATSFHMPTKVGEPVIGRVEADGDQVHVYKFRAIELDEMDDEDGEDDYGLDEGDEGGTDPFVPPKPSTVTRVLHFVQDMKAELLLQQEQMLRLVEARLGQGTEGVDSQPGGGAQRSTNRR